MVLALAKPCFGSYRDSEGFTYSVLQDQTTSSCLGPPTPRHVSLESARLESKRHEHNLADSQLPRQSQHELHVKLPVAAMLSPPSWYRRWPMPSRGDWARTRWPRYALYTLYIIFIPWIAKLTRLENHTLLIRDPHGVDA